MKVKADMLIVVDLIQNVNIYVYETTSAIIENGRKLCFNWEKNLNF